MFTFGGSGAQVVEVNVNRSRTAHKADNITLRTVQRAQMPVHLQKPHKLWLHCIILRHACLYPSCVYPALTNSPNGTTCNDGPHVALFTTRAISRRSIAPANHAA